MSVLRSTSTPEPEHWRLLLTIVHHHLLVDRPDVLEVEEDWFNEGSLIALKFSDDVGLLERRLEFNILIDGFDHVLSQLKVHEGFLGVRLGRVSLYAH